MASLDHTPPPSTERLAEIRERHARAKTLAESLPPIIDDWENGEGFITGEEVIYLFHETRMGKDAGEFTFALHAWEDMRDVLVTVDRLNAGQLAQAVHRALDAASTDGAESVLAWLSDYVNGVGGISLPLPDSQDGGDR